MILLSVATTEPQKPSRSLQDPPWESLPPETGAALRPGPVADFGSVLRLSAVGMPNGGEAKRYAFRSTDRGATWTYTGVVPSAQDELVFLTSTHWLQIVPPDRSQETTDAGGSWHAFKTDYQQAAPVAPQIGFGDANTGYATVRGQLQRTTDGGAHWTSLKTPGT